MAPRESRIESVGYSLQSGNASPRLAEKLRGQTAKPEPTAAARAREKAATIKAIEERQAKEAAKEAAKFSYVELELVDEDDKPVGNAKYLVVDTGGQRVTGTLDGSGKARVEKLSHGPVRVTFPDFDGYDWWIDGTPRAQPPPKVAEKDHLELELVDDAGQPVANAAFVVIDENGARHEGRTDAHGQVRLEKIALGRARVTFPDYDAGDWAA